jgi:hypothetical protein
MMRRRLSLLAAVVLVAACNASDSTAPQSNRDHAAANRSSMVGYIHDGHMIPGSGGLAGAATQEHHPLACSVPVALWGSAIIGAKGGELVVGTHRLIVPAGALTEDTQLSATVPAGSLMEIHFEPHGLQFKKPAGLVIDASACGEVPNVVYLDEMGGIAEHIRAVFSTWWHTIAAPIDHFSGYMLEV